MLQCKGHRLVTLIHKVSLTLIDIVPIGLVTICHRKTWKQISCSIYKLILDLKKSILKKT